MYSDDHRAELLERAYRRGYELRLRRRRWLATVSGLVAIAVVAGVAVTVSRTGNSKVSVGNEKKTTPTTSRDACPASISVVPRAEVPRDVAAWAGDRAVVGGGALWTIRSAIDVPVDHQRAGWLLKFPWYTRPFGLPTITGRRLDGPGTFHADANAATDSRGTWVVSSFEFSGPGCWQVTGRYRSSTMRFRVHVVAESKTAPTEIVALERNGFRIVVMSATSRKVIRVLATSQGLIRYLPTLAVTPDARTVYFTTSRRPTRAECSAGLVDEVAQVPIRGGSVSVVGPGVFPAVSPNGKFLAYTRNATSPCNSNHDELVVVDINSGTRRTFVSHSNADFAFLTWAPDSSHLAYYQSDRSLTRPWLINAATARTLDDATAIPTVNADWGGFLGPTGAGIGVTPHNGSDANPATVVELDATTGAQTRTLFTIPGGLNVANVLDGPEDALHADRSGKNVLAVGLLPSAGPERHGALYSWRDGDRIPVLLADQIEAAVWVEPANPTPTSSP